MNNAGASRPVPAADHDDASWDAGSSGQPDRTIRAGTREMEDMVERGYGKVIFTASLLSFQGGLLVPSYAASKSAVAGLVRAFSNEWLRMVSM